MCSHPITFDGVNGHIFCSVCLRDLTSDESIEEVEKKMRDDYDVPTYAVKEKTAETLSEKLDQILKLFKDQESRVSTMLPVVSDLESRVKELEESPAVEDLENQVAELDQRIDDLGEVEDITTRVEDLESQLEDLKDTLRNV